MFLTWGARQPALERWSTLKTLPWARAEELGEEDAFLNSPLDLVNPAKHQKNKEPLTVPPPVLPEALPPQAAWPELPIQSNAPGFSDVPDNHWAFPILADLVDRQLVAGFPDRTFRPAEPMTRAEFAAQLARLFDFPTQQTAPAYQDVSRDYWGQMPVQKAVQMGFLTGYPENTFLPDQAISRIHVIVALAQGLNLKSSSGTTAVLKQYADYAQIPAWAERPVVAATEAGLVVNYPALAYLEPNRLASRAEVMAMIHRALVYTGQIQEVPFPHVVVPSPLPH
ncbi:MAG: S-layer homology domain-containing protein [Leptolyngbyaceae cyanobacterium SM2_3_12]|nr:S-layer homology domain-containing protein [Leptolyngbyaceae cyanobacterium SM2_3_12]